MTFAKRRAVTSTALIATVAVLFAAFFAFKVFIATAKLAVRLFVLAILVGVGAGAYFLLST